MARFTPSATPGSNPGPRSSGRTPYRLRASPAWWPPALHSVWPRAPSSAWPSPSARTDSRCSRRPLSARPMTWATTTPWTASVTFQCLTCGQPQRHQFRIQWFKSHADAVGWTVTYVKTAQQETPGQAFRPQYVAGDAVMALRTRRRGPHLPGSSTRSAFRLASRWKPSRCPKKRRPSYGALGYFLIFLSGPALTAIRRRCRRLGVPNRRYGGNRGTRKRFVVIQNVIQ